MYFSKKIVWCIALATVSVLAVASLCLGRHAHSHSLFSLEHAYGKENLVPLLIIGSGPAGLNAAKRGGDARIPTIVLTGDEKGGLLMKTSSVTNFPGIKKASGKEIMDMLFAQATDAGAQLLADAAYAVDFSQWPYVIYTANGLTLHAMAVIIATGATPKKLGIPGEGEDESGYWGRGVAVCAICDAHAYEGKEVVVVGGGESAIVKALQLSAYANKVTIIVRKDHMRATQTNQDQLKSYPNIHVVYHSEVTSIIGDGQVVTGVDVYNNETGNTTHMPTDGVFLAIGHEPNSGIFKPWVAVESDGLIFIKDKSQKTSRPGVFAAGDVEDPYGQADRAAGNGKAAALDAEEFLKEIGFYPQKEALAPYYFDPSKMRNYSLAALDTTDEVNAVIESSKSMPTVLYFSSEQCPLCVQLEPVVEAVSSHFAANKVQFFKVDTDAQGMQSILEKLHVYGTPSVRILVDRQIVAQSNAPDISRQQLAELIEKVL